MGMSRTAKSVKTLARHSKRLPMRLMRVSRVSLRYLLRVDIDAGNNIVPVPRMCWLLRRAGYRVVWYSQVRSPSGKGWHLEIRVKPRPRSYVVVTALQLLLGSDPFREACNMNRAQIAPALPAYWQDRWNVLYAPK